MKSTHKLLILIGLLAFLITPAIVGAAPPPPEEDFQINWWSIDGGGGVSTAEEYTLMGAIGQHDAGKLGTGEYSLQGGFWVKGILEEIVEFFVNLPLVLR
jgi:hypothetical protein